MDFELLDDRVFQSEAMFFGSAFEVRDEKSQKGKIPSNCAPGFADQPTSAFNNNVLPPPSVEQRPSFTATGPISFCPAPVITPVNPSSVSPIAFTTPATVPQQVQVIEIPRLVPLDTDNMVCIPDDGAVQRVTKVQTKEGKNEHAIYIPVYNTRLAPVTTSQPLYIPRQMPVQVKFESTPAKPAAPAAAQPAAPKKAAKPVSRSSSFLQTQRMAPKFPRMDRSAFVAHQDDAYASRPEGKVGKDGRRRLVWTPELHNRFVTAVRVLGIKSSVPKNVLQLMNVEGITRENVASRLQKFRLFVRRMHAGLGDLADDVPLEDSHLTAEIEQAALNSSKLCT
ncbi:Myb-like DNA-binding domain [Carpediemonas membranifera]|uniref:Myb-like DNA-binding domain n=1 Tax=Carpediemonas membranifera TaxID=201153 RepID=A0A8J6BCS6_9EUKA|nr:Myb-like DNA-binding domain [Carpediemonas membranifera]|eukprot:KAG9397502.1 Myb-like DNA-binding domain [Carpediemonas membranifera]